MKNIDEVRQNLTFVFDGLKAKTLTVKEAQEMNNACGKVIATAKVELEYYALRKEMPAMTFLQIVTRAPTKKAIENAAKPRSGNK